MTTNDPIAAYQQALQKYEHAKRAVEAMVSLIDVAATALKRDWRRVGVSNVNIGFPAEVILIPGNLSINGSDWPDGKRLAETLAGYHSAKHELDNAYARIPDSYRSVIQPPPEK